MRIAFVGKMHSGKTTAVIKFKEYIKNSKSTTLIKLADPLYKSHDIFNINNNPKHRIFLQSLSDLSKQCFGENILSEIFELNLKDFLNKGYNNFLCDDVRVMSEFKTVSNLNFVTVGIKSLGSVRKQRNPDLFVGTAHKTEKEVENLIKLCDFKIDNNGTLYEFYRNLKLIYDQIEQESRNM